MTAYINSLIAVMIVCQIASVIAPDSENAKKYIRTICALVVLLTLISPIQYLAISADNITEKITDFFTSEAVGAEYDEHEAGAVGIMQYISERYGTAEMSAVIITNEEDTAITEIQLFIKNCPYSTRINIEAEMSLMLEIPVYVFCEQ